MKQGEALNKFIEHYSRSISCSNCFIEKECDHDFQSIKTCENRMKLAFEKLEKQK